MANPVFLSLNDLLGDTPQDPPTVLPPITDVAQWRVRLSREGHPQGAESPLKDVYAQLEAAGNLPNPQPYTSPDEPLLTLVRRIQEPEFFAEPESSPEPVTAPEPALPAILPETPTVAPSPVPPSFAAAPSPLATLLGEEVLAMVASRDLSADSRTEAIEATVMALENPTLENIRSILRALLRG